jgi:hypothetical protein
MHTCQAGVVAAFLHSLTARFFLTTTVQGVREYSVSYSVHSFAGSHLLHTAVFIIHSSASLDVLFDHRAGLTKMAHAYAWALNMHVQTPQAASATIGGAEDQRVSFNFYQLVLQYFGYHPLLDEFERPPLGPTVEFGGSAKGIAQ